MINQDIDNSSQTVASADGDDVMAHKTAAGAPVLKVLVVLARRRGLIGAATAIGLLAGIVISLTRPVVYSATTRILTPHQAPALSPLLMSSTQGSASNAGSIASLASVGFLMQSPNDTYIGLLKSRPVTDAIIDQFGLVKSEHAPDMTAARQALQASTKIESEKSGFIAITFTDSDKKRAAAIANAYTSQLRHLSQSLAITDSSQRRLFYEEQLERAKDDLVKAEFAFQQVQQKKGLIQVGAQAAAMVNGLASLRAQVAAKEVEVQALRSYSTERNPDVQLAENQLSSLRDEVAALERRNHSAGPFDLGMEDVPAASLEYLSAEHEVQYRQALLDLLLKLYDGARLDEAREATIIQVVEPAIEPDRRSSPNRKLICIIGMFVGFLIGWSVALVERFGKSLASDQIIAKQIQDLMDAFKRKEK